MLIDTSDVRLTVNTKPVKAYLAEPANGGPGILLYYGSGEADLGRIQSRTLGHYSDVDDWKPCDEIQQMERNMKDAGVDFRFHTYPGMAH